MLGPGERARGPGERERKGLGERARGPGERERMGPGLVFIPQSASKFPDVSLNKLLAIGDLELALGLLISCLPPV